MPVEMQRWFSLPRISAFDLDGVRIGDDFLDDNTSMFLLLETLSMGFSWSLFFAQSAHETIVRQHGGLTAGDLSTSRQVVVSKMTESLTCNTWITSLHWEGIR